MSKLSETDLILNPDGSVYHLNLKPSNVSETIITVGDPNRVHRISQHFDHIDFEMNKREFITHTGTYKGKRLTVISSGMGTDNVEILMVELDALFNIDLRKRKPKEDRKQLQIVRIGTSGAIQEDIPLGTHIASEYAVGLDPLAHFYELPQSDYESGVSSTLQTTLQLPYKPYCIQGSTKLIEKFASFSSTGNTLTCPGFYGSQGRAITLPIKYPRMVEELTGFHPHDFWISNMEMETAGYYAMGRLLGHEMISLNAIIANRMQRKFSKDPNQVIDSLIVNVLEAL
ncbi:MAG: nucleoside phosphorylase [Bacteroidota bacterium]